jgi:hypothetical protein
MYKLSLNADNVRELLERLPETMRFSDIRWQLEDFLSDIEFNEIFNECEIDLF